MHAPIYILWGTEKLLIMHHYKAKFEEDFCTRRGYQTGLLISFFHNYEEHADTVLLFYPFRLWSREEIKTKTKTDYNNKQYINTERDVTDDWDIDMRWEILERRYIRFPFWGPQVILYNALKDDFNYNEY